VRFFLLAFIFQQWRLLQKMTKPILLILALMVLAGNVWADDSKIYAIVNSDARSENDCTRWNEGTEGRELCRIAQALEVIAQK
jgi:hypothetical protein